MAIITLGPAGTYSHRAAAALGEDVVFTESVGAIVDAVDGGVEPQGVVPIENSIEGSVTEALDALARADVAVTQEIVTPIRHALVGRSHEPTTIASHPQALSQCREYLDAHHADATLEAVASTAQGVVRAGDAPDVAAIAHPATATGELEVLAADIQDRASNTTRFFAIAPAADRSTAGGKSTVIVYPNTNYPGLLLELLESFADRAINLSRIESRPSGQRLGDYIFHIDLEAGLFEERTQAAMASVEAIADAGWVKPLGSYDTRHVV
jgi:prephenate dehydratase (EC 4.2.1.51)